MKFLQGSSLAFTEADMKPLNEEQNQAILEALFIAIAADGKTTPQELQAFGASVASYPWNFGNDEKVLVKKVEAIAAKLATLGKDKAKLTEHLKSLGTRVPANLKEKTITGMFALFLADGEFNQQEQTTLVAFANVFGISETRGKQIGEEVVSLIKKAVGK